MILYVSKSMSFATGRLSGRRKQGFTLREILVIVIVVSVGLLSVVAVLTNGMKYVQRTRQKIIALNLAREGMEAVYQIRDTNRTRRAGVKDQCRLKINPLVDEGSPRCVDDLRFTSGSYVLETLSAGSEPYFALTGPWTSLDLDAGGIDSGDLQFSLCQSGGTRYACPGLQPQATEGMFFREIQGRGLYLKDVSVTGGVAMDCTGSLGPDADCGGSRAKEFRFCSMVSYIGAYTGSVRLCGVITNFKAK